jgi:hypothetical protein
MIRKAQSGKLSAEKRQNLDSLLTEIRAQVVPPMELPAIRAVEVLEHIATPAARELLAELAKGAPAARLTVEATASLERLKAK